MKRRLTFFFLFVSLAVSAQQFNIVRSEMAGNEIFIFYNLLDTIKNRTYTVSLYSSVDGFTSPLKNVSGESGLEVKPGSNKKVVLNVASEFGTSFSGYVSFEIRGRLYQPFIRLTGFDDIKTWKRGVPVTLTWTGGTSRNILNFDLYDGTKKVWTQPGVGNTGNYKMVVPTSVKPGSNYHFRITDSKNKDEIVNTGTFRLKRRIPLLLTAGVFVGVAGAVYYLIPKDKGFVIGDPGCPEGDNSCNE